MENENDQYIHRLLERLDEIGDLELILLVNRLIDERTYLAETIQIDPLTGLYNRRILERVREPGTVIMCDIDNFKSVNDTFGHDTGDIVIKEVANIILHNVRYNDIVCRFGGDEYLVIISTNDRKTIEERINKICDEVRSTIKLPNLLVSLSVGVAFNDNEEEVNTLIEKADKALYQSKENGKNQVTYYEQQKVKKI